MCLHSYANVTQFSSSSTSAIKMMICIFVTIKLNMYEMTKNFRLQYFFLRFEIINFIIYPIFTLLHDNFLIQQFFSKIVFFIFLVLLLLSTIFFSFYFIWQTFIVYCIYYFFFVFVISFVFLQSIYLLLFFIFYYIFCFSLTQPHLAFFFRFSNFICLPTLSLLSTHFCFFLVYILVLSHILFLQLSLLYISAKLTLTFLIAFLFVLVNF